MMGSGNSERGWGVSEWDTGVELMQEWKIGS